jgi:hypothetical protein
MMFNIAMSITRFSRSSLAGPVCSTWVNIQCKLPRQVAQDSAQVNTSIRIRSLPFQTAKLQPLAYPDSPPVVREGALREIESNLHLTIDNLNATTPSVKVDVQVGRPDHSGNLVGQCYCHHIWWSPLCQLSNPFAGFPGVSVQFVALMFAIMQNCLF